MAFPDICREGAVTDGVKKLPQTRAQQVRVEIHRGADREEGITIF
jgi:hypothetical protein